MQFIVSRCACRFREHVSPAFLKALMNVHLYILYILLSVIVLHVHYLYPTTMNSYTAVFIQRIGSNLSYLQFNIFLKKNLVLNISVFSPFTHLSSKQNGDIPGDNVSCLIYNE